MVGRSVTGMSRPLHPDVMLGIRLSTICSRNRYETDTAPVIAELLEVAGDRGDVLGMEAGKWAGYYDDEHTAALGAAIIAWIPRWWSPLRPCAWIFEGVGGGSGSLRVMAQQAWQTFENDGDDLPLFMARSWAEASVRHYREARELRRRFVTLDKAHERMDPVEITWHDVMGAFSAAWTAESMLIISASQFEVWLAKLYESRGLTPPERMPYLRELRNAIVHLDASVIDTESWTARPSERQTRTGVGALPDGELLIWLNGTEDVLGVISADALEAYVRSLLDELRDELDDYASDWFAEMLREQWR